MAACSNDHKDANASVTKFLTELIKLASEKPVWFSRHDCWSHQQLLLLQEKNNFADRRSLVLSLLSEHGQSLVAALINACVYCLPSYLLTDSAEVLHELILLDNAVSIAWDLTDCE